MGLVVLGVVLRVEACLSRLLSCLVKAVLELEWLSEVEVWRGIGG